jgi:hypothetical protein
MRRVACQAFVLLAALGMLAGAVPHALSGWPALQAALAPYGVDAGTLGALSAGWYWGSVTMLALGLVGFFVYLDLRRGRATARRYGLAAGGAYLAFGLAAYVGRDFNSHFLFFVVLGALMCGAVAAWPAPANAPRERDRA